MHHQTGEIKLIITGHFVLTDGVEHGKMPISHGTLNNNR